MPIDKEQIKKALDDFENDDFMSAKDKLKDEIRKSRDEYVKDKTNLKNDIGDQNQDDDNNDDDEDDEE